MADTDYSYNDDEEDAKTDINLGKQVLPHFDVTEYALEVKSGEKAILECPVKNLSGKLKVFYFCNLRFD